MKQVLKLRSGLIRTLQLSSLPVDWSEFPHQRLLSKGCQVSRREMMAKMRWRKTSMTGMTMTPTSMTSSSMKMEYGISRGCRLPVDGRGFDVENDKLLAVGVVLDAL